MTILTYEKYVSSGEIGACESYCTATLKVIENVTCYESRSFTYYPETKRQSTYCKGTTLPRFVIQTQH